jgi:hypothetical protein
VSNSLKIPTWRADGSRFRDFSLEAIEHLERLSKVVVKRSRRGKVLAAHFRPTDGSNPLRATATLGQRYHVLEHAGNYRLWQHRRLIPSQDLEQLLGVALDSPEEIDLYLRGIFRAVPLSVLTR